MAFNIIIALKLQILFQISQAFNVDILVSNSTPPGLANYLWRSLNEKFQRDFTFILTSAEDCNFQIGCIHLPSLAIDATFNSFYSFQIRAYSETSHFLYINLNQQIGIYGKYEFFSHNSRDFHYQALNQLIKYFGWKNFIVIANSAVNPISLLLKKEGKGLPVLCTDTENQDIYDLIIGREVKPTGIGNIIILNSGRSSSMIVTSLGSKMMLKSGYGVIMGSDSIWGNFTNDGLVFYTEEGLENATSYNHYEYLALEKVLKTVLQVIDYKTQEIMQILEKRTINHSPFPNFSIINIQNGQKIKVGGIANGKISIKNALVYPGNSTTIPNLPRANITISLADGVRDPGGINATYNILIRHGNYFAFRSARQSGLLRSFNLNVQSTDCGVTLYSKNLSRPCFEKLKDKIGVVHLSSKRDPVCIGIITDFRALGISAPIISNGCEFTPELLNKSIFPEFMTIYKEESFTAGVFPELASIFGWKKVVVVHRPEWSKKTYDTMVTKLSKYHIEVANNPSYYFTTVYTTDQLEDYKDYFLDIINSKCRILIALVDPKTFANFLISLYDLGMRKGDILFLLPYRYSLTDLLSSFEGDSAKLLEMFQRSLTANLAEWIGDYGQSLKNQCEQIYHHSNHLGFSYDQTMLALNGIDYSITKGDNLENSTAINENIRKQKFFGATGTLSIEPDGNSRSIFYVNIFSVLPIANASLNGDEVVGNYSISGNQRFLFNKIIWPGETNVIPSNMRTNQIDCPFSYRLVQDSLDGKMVFLAIVSSLIIVEISLVVFLQKRWKEVKFEDLKEPKMIKFGDFLMMAILWIETLELISIGPNMKSYSTVISQFIRLFSADWNGPLNVHGDSFWIEVYIVVSIISFMGYSAFIVTKKYSEKYSNYFFEVNELISEIGILLLCSIAYIPLVSILFSVFLCKESAGDSITDSFVSNDCYTYCWKGFHLSISLLCLIILLLYMTLTIYFQPSWQLYHPIFNIALHPKTAVYKSALYFIMIGVNKNLDFVSKALEGMVYSFILLALAFIYWKIRIYNYPRMNMWAIISVFAVIWSNVISSIYSLVNDDMNSLWELGLIIGWGILGVAGMVLQALKFQNLLITEKGIEMGFLFKFSLGSKICATEINILKINNGSYSKDPLFASSKTPDSHLKNEENFAGSQWISDN
ncbi:unnamed protein product [Blepharisma stoltei]|uniref:Receptor ligand binding region domain-containing protein n=1 Tax=Blepharisma stoltei TaxID=1481888 RepID=A0AAU9INW0_9CILI|nr:unnamed protein product [Blepharisma stoltei]